MPDASTLTVFAGASLLMLLVPGPAVLYIAARSMQGGRAAALLSVLGIAVGTIAHIVAAAFGLSAILVRSATAFDAVRYAGAAYLIWLGITAFRRKDPVEGIEVEPEPLRRVFAQGIMVNLLNPKTALFFFAFLPQFVRPGHGSPTTQILFLGFFFLGMGMTTDAIYAVVAGSFSDWLRARMRTMRYMSGAIYIALGITAAVTGSRNPSS